MAGVARLTEVRSQAFPGKCSNDLPNGIVEPDWSCEVISGRSVTIHLEAERCVHARNCVRGRPDVFVPNVAGEWIHPDNATPDEVAALAANCPSGAIAYERFDGVANEQPPLVNTVRVRENGPLAFHGPLTIAGAEQAPRATLCRCGASAHKPYCDGSHKAAGFLAP